MSDELEGSPVTGSLAKALATDEIESMMEGEQTAQSAGQDLGRRVGRELGAQIGGEVGATVAADLRERKHPRTIIRNAAKRVRDVLSDVIASINFSTVISRAIELGESLSVGEAAEDVIDIATPGEERSTSTDEQETADATDEETEEDAADGPDVSSDDLQSMREETYKELMDVMSYRSLQGLAKEVGVQANLSRDELVKRITAEFSEGSPE